MLKIQDFKTQNSEMSNPTQVESKTPYLRMIAVGVGLLAILAVWTVVYWHDVSTLTEYESSNLVYGKGFVGLESNEKYFCRGWKSGIYGCNFSEAMDKYIGLTIFGVVFLPLVLIRPNILLYTFYSIVVVAFLKSEST